MSVRLWPSAPRFQARRRPLDFGLRASSLAKIPKSYTGLKILCLTVFQYVLYRNGQLVQDMAISVQGDGDAGMA